MIQYVRDNQPVQKFGAPIRYQTSHEKTPQKAIGLVETLILIWPICRQFPKSAKKKQKKTEIEPTWANIYIHVV